MGIRSTVGSKVESAIGHANTNRIRKLERRTRNALAKRLAMEPPKKKRKKRSGAKPSTNPRAAKPAAAAPSRWWPNDPFVAHRTPTMTRHELLKGLHAKIRPRTYLEIGVSNGRSMMLSGLARSALIPVSRLTDRSTATSNLPD